MHSSAGLLPLGGAVEGVTDGGSKVAAVGHAHVENFGTWRDEGRLVWGVNDFDEACELPWTSDLVRLGVSAMLALGKLENFNLSTEDACDAILGGCAEAGPPATPCRWCSLRNTMYSGANAVSIRLTLSTQRLGAAVRGYGTRPKDTDGVLFRQRLRQFGIRHPHSPCEFLKFENSFPA